MDVVTNTECGSYGNKVKDACRGKRKIAPDRIEGTGFFARSWRDFCL